MPTYEQIQAGVSKKTYESVSSIAEALPESKREEFAALMDDLQRNAIPNGSIRRIGIRRWIKDAGWGVS